MKASAKSRMQWTTVGYMTVFWCIVGILQALYKSVNYNASIHEVIFAAPKGYSLFEFVLINLIGPVLAGAVAAPLIVFILRDKLRNKSYLTFILVMGLVFFLLILLLNALVSWIFYYQDLFQESSYNLTDSLYFFLLDPYALRNILTWMLIGFITVVWLQVSDKYGPGMFNKFMLGKYYNPKEEERIFLFLDLMGSTPIAERLGHIQFFKLLSMYFEDMTDSILENHGDIYQYIGDEIVVSWTKEKGLKKASCLECFFDIEQAITHKAANYQAQFGLVPKFRAGIHMGKVVVGEIGIIKKDISYSGDVLNTTARILESCKSLGQKLIISDTLYQSITTDHNPYTFTDLGPRSLRGKDVAIGLWAVNK
jgi:adenylate cyclase